MLEPLRKLAPRSPTWSANALSGYAADDRWVAPFGHRSYWKSRFLCDLPDVAIDVFAEFADSRTSARSLAVLEHAHGAVCRVAPDVTAFPTRTAPFDLV